MYITVGHKRNTDICIYIYIYIVIDFGRVANTPNPRSLG